MRRLLAFVLLAAAHAHADLYRWVDRETGSVKFSSYPPPWYGDPERERGAPPVEVIRGTAAPQPANPAKPAAAVAGLEADWRALVEYFAALPPGLDAERLAALKPQVERYQSLSAELDRRDPAGAARRNAQAQAALEPLRSAR